MRAFLEIFGLVGIFQPPKAAASKVWERQSMAVVCQNLGITQIPLKGLNNVAEHFGFF